MDNGVQYAKRVVVTGAGSGIGKGVALLLRERGSEVVAVDLHEDSLADAVAAGAEGVVCDVTKAADRARLLEVAGDVDGLVNAAGIIRLLPVTEVTEETWDSIFDVNVKALFFLARDFGLRMPVGAGHRQPGIGRRQEQRHDRGTGVRHVEVGRARGHAQPRELLRPVRRARERGAPRHHGHADAGQGARGDRGDPRRRRRRRCTRRA